MPVNSSTSGTQPVAPLSGADGGNSSSTTNNTTNTGNNNTATNTQSTQSTTNTSNTGQTNNTNGSTGSTNPANSGGQAASSTTRPAGDTQNQQNIDIPTVSTEDGGDEPSTRQRDSGPSVYDKLYGSESLDKTRANQLRDLDALVQKAQKGDAKAQQKLDQMARSAEATAKTPAEDQVDLASKSEDERKQAQEKRREQARELKKEGLLNRLIAKKLKSGQKQAVNHTIRQQLGSQATRFDNASQKLAQLFQKLELKNQSDQLRDQGEQFKKLLNNSSNQEQKNPQFKSKMGEFKIASDGQIVQSGKRSNPAQQSQPQKQAQNTNSNKNQQNQPNNEQKQKLDGERQVTEDLKKPTDANLREAQKAVVAKFGKDLVEKRLKNEKLAENVTRKLLASKRDFKESDSPKAMAFGAAMQKTAQGLFEGRSKSTIAGLAIFSKEGRKLLKLEQNPEDGQHPSAITVAQQVQAQEILGEDGQINREVLLERKAHLFDQRQGEFVADEFTAAHEQGERDRSSVAAHLANEIADSRA